jgi:hypothetical protein
MRQGRGSSSGGGRKKTRPPQHRAAFKQKERDKNQTRSLVSGVGAESWLAGRWDKVPFDAAEWVRQARELTSKPRKPHAGHYPDLYPEIGKLAEEHGLRRNTVKSRIAAGIPLDVPLIRHNNAKAWETRRLKLK